jgi:hypothetical protein
MVRSSGRDGTLLLGLQIVCSADAVFIRGRNCGRRDDGHTCSGLVQNNLLIFRHIEEGPTVEFFGLGVAGLPPAELFPRADQKEKEVARYLEDD